MQETKLRDGAIIKHHDEGDYIASVISKTKDYFESKTLREINNAGLFPGDGDYIEIGANIGNHIVYYKNHTGANHIYAFEPLKDNYNIAFENVKSNNLSNVEINKYGLGNKDAMLSFYVNKSNYGNSSVNKQELSENIKTKVEIRNINDILPKLILTSTFMKIDIEGAEKFIINEILNLTRNHNINIWIELRPSDYSLNEYIQISKKFCESGFKLKYNRDFDFVFSKSGKQNKIVSFKKIYVNGIAQDIRNRYDSATSKTEIRTLESKYKVIRNRGKISFVNKLIWSKFYRFFTFKFLT